MSSFCANILWSKKLQSQPVIIENLCKALLYKKALLKVLMKLTIVETIFIKFQFLKQDNNLSFILVEHVQKRVFMYSLN